MAPHPVSPPSPPIPHNALGQSPGSQGVTGELSPAKAKVKDLTRLQLKGLNCHSCGSTLLVQIPSHSQLPVTTTICSVPPGKGGQALAMLGTELHQPHTGKEGTCTLVCRSSGDSRRGFRALCRKTKPEWAWQEPPSPTGLPGQGCGWATQVESYFSGTG